LLDGSEKSKTVNFAAGKMLGESDAAMDRMYTDFHTMFLFWSLTISIETPHWQPAGGTNTAQSIE
jgi:hypothetical protein